MTAKPGSPYERAKDTLDDEYVTGAFERTDARALIATVEALELLLIQTQHEQDASAVARAALALAKGETDE